MKMDNFRAVAKRTLRERSIYPWTAVVDFQRPSTLISSSGTPLFERSEAAPDLQECRPNSSGFKERAGRRALNSESATLYVTGEGCMKKQCLSETQESFGKI